MWWEVLLMSKTNRQEPRNGQFKKMRGHNKKRKCDRQDAKAVLRKDVQLTNRKPNTGYKNYNEEYYEELRDDIEDIVEFKSVDLLLKDLHE